MATRKNSPDPSRSPSPVVRVAPLGELNAYTVYEHELDTLAKGSTGSILLNLSFALLPFAGALLITLMTTTIASDRLYLVFLCTCIICFIAGAICLLIGWLSHVSTVALAQEIKNRMPQPRGRQEAATAPILPAQTGVAPPAAPPKSPSE